MFFRDTRVLASFELKINGQDGDILGVRRVVIGKSSKSRQPDAPSKEVAGCVRTAGIEQRARLDTGLSLDVRFVTSSGSLSVR